jgi:hypothetical protein
MKGGDRWMIFEAKSPLCWGNVEMSPSFVIYLTSIYVGERDIFVYYNLPFDKKKKGGYNIFLT